MDNMIMKASPRKMMSEVSSVSTLGWIGVAALIHLVILVATSYDYVRDRWIDPSGAAARHAALVVTPTPAIPAVAKTPPVAPPVQKPTAERTDPEQFLKEHPDNPVVKHLTEKAKPGDIPKSPNQNGFNLDDSTLK